MFLQPFAGLGCFSVCARFGSVPLLGIKMPRFAGLCQPVAAGGQWSAGQALCQEL